MALAHDILRAAAKVALQGQQSVIAGLDQVEDEYHRKALVDLSGQFNKLASVIYKTLQLMEREDGEDEETEQ